MVKRNKPTSQSDSLVNLIGRFQQEVGKYLSISGVLNMTVKLVAPRVEYFNGMRGIIETSNADLERIGMYQKEQGDWRNKLAQTGRDLASALAASGHDASGVLQIVHRAAGGGGGPTKVAEAWEAVKIGLQAIAIRKPMTPKRGRIATGTISRDLVWLDEFEQDYQGQEISYFAQQKNMKRDTMSKALGRARKARESRTNRVNSRSPK